MTNKKITKKERFEEMVAYFKGIGREDLADFCSHEIDLLVKKNAGKSKVSAAEQEKREAIADAVIAILTNADAPMPNADICKAMPDSIGTLNTQKLTPILAKLVEGGAIEVATVKGRKVFHIV